MSVMSDEAAEEESLSSPASYGTYLPTIYVRTDCWSRLKTVF